MPSPWDIHTAATRSNLGRGFPGSNETKAWQDGWVYRYGGTALDRPVTDNPWDKDLRPTEYQAWQDGWTEANDNTAGERRGPATTGAPPV